MTRGVFNWTYNDVVSVLKEHGFHLNHVKGSHHYFIGTVGGVMRQVCVPKHGSQSFKPRTFKGMVSQSGLSKEDWDF